MFVPVALGGSLHHREWEGDEKAEDEPEVDHLGVRRWWQLRDFACENRRHDQHDGQVEGALCFKVDLAEEGGGIGDHE